MSDQLDDILTIDGVAAYLKASKGKAYRLALSGYIPALKLGGHGDSVGKNLFSGLLLPSTIPPVLRTRGAWND
jgi:excisionase family DNA binding protein